MYGLFKGNIWALYPPCTLLSCTEVEQAKDCILQLLLYPVLQLLLCKNFSFNDRTLVCKTWEVVPAVWHIAEARLSPVTAAGCRRGLSTQFHQGAWWGIHVACAHGSWSWVMPQPAVQVAPSRSRRLPARDHGGVALEQLVPRWGRAQLLVFQAEGWCESHSIGIVNCSSNVLTLPCCAHWIGSVNSTDWHSLLSFQHHSHFSLIFQQMYSLKVFREQRVRSNFSSRMTQ